MSEHMKGSQRAQNLARIRENQRRSRARRKEYVEELESKLRSCERLGIEASAELQTAARRVLDENKKLRWFLNMRGVSDPEIAAVMGWPVDKPFNQTSSATALNTMLERRLTSDLVLSTASLSPHTRPASVPRNLHSTLPTTTPVTCTTGLSSCDSPSPMSMLSSTGTPPSTSYCTPLYRAPMNTQTPEIKSEEASYDYPYEAYITPWGYSYNYGYTSNTVAYQDTCVDAANTLTTLRHDATSQPAVELACPTPMRDYYSNNAAFEMEERSYNRHAT